jgi:hypothetical protein
MESIALSVAVTRDSNTTQPGRTRKNHRQNHRQTLPALVQAPPPVRRNENPASPAVNADDASQSAHRNGTLRSDAQRGPDRGFVSVGLSLV